MSSLFLNFWEIFCSTSFYISTEPTLNIKASLPEGKLAKVVIVECHTVKACELVNVITKSGCCRITRWGACGITISLYFGYISNIIITVTEGFVKSLI